jgi:hypothetical protein
VTPVLDYLKELVEKEEYERALQVAMEVLFRPDNDLEGLMRVNLIIAECRIRLKDPLGALPSAQLASKLAQDHNYYDLAAEAELCKGSAYTLARQYDEAMAAFFLVIEMGPNLLNRGRMEFASWRYLGYVYERLNQSEQQIWALRNAWRLSRHTQPGPERNSLHTMLIHALLSDKKYDEAKSLLTEWRAYLKEHPDDAHAQYLYHLDLCRFALDTRKFRYASRLALDGLDKYKGNPVRQFTFYQSLYQASLGLNRPEEALGYALAARMVAIESRRYDVEFEAAEWVVGLIRTYGSSLVARLDRQYLNQGVNLGQYLAPTAWQS